MRGRLRCVFDAQQLIRGEKSKNEGESSNEGMIDYGVPDGKQYPDYDDMSPYFSIKLCFGGKFTSRFTDYVGGKIAYYDMCSVLMLTLTEMEAMFGEVGCSTETMDFWLLSNESEMCPDNLFPIETGSDMDVVINLVDCNYKLLTFYASSNSPSSDDEGWDFSFTQMAIDDRIERIEDIRVEVDEIMNEKGSSEEDVEEEKLSFHGDSSNLDSSESDCPKPKKKVRRVPPPNPPYRARRKGRYSKLRGLFKNTEDTPVVLDDADEVVHTPPQSSQGTKKNKSEQKKDKKAFKKKGKKPHQKKGKEKVKPKQKGEDKVSNQKKGETSNVQKQATTDEEQLESVINDNDKDLVVTTQCITGQEDEGVINDSDSSESDYDSNDERMAISSCDEQEIKYPEFNELTDMEDPQFQLGMLFISGKAFRDAVRKHAIVHQRGIRLKKNHGDKIKWICTEGCQWKCYGIRQQRSTNIQIKTLLNKHTCNPTWVQKQVNSSWIATAYEHEVRMNPTWPVASFRAKVVNDLKCEISDSMIYRAMRKAKEKIIGRHEDEFKKLYEYANEVKKVMPSSTIKLMTEPAEPGVEGRRFKRFYVCLGPLKEGFLHGCRPIIGLDGCHLKGPFGGILLTAIGTDPNEGMYPIAWAQVEQENTSSWYWFLGLLKADLDIQNDGTYTFISDRQKVIALVGPCHVLEEEEKFYWEKCSWG